MSVVIPNYNHASYIGAAIQSVLNQTYRTFEIIVVDDGSTDNSREVVAQFGDQVTYLWQENRGLSAARNTGIQAANGTYIGLLDADDLYEPAFLSTLVPILQANPQTDGVYCGYRFVDHNNHPLPQVEARLIADGQLYQALVDGNFLVPESMLVRRSCYASVPPFDESLRACEDWDMWLAISRQYKIVGTDRVLTRHRILPGSMSTDPKRMLKNRMAVLAKHFGPEPTAATGWTAAQQRAYGHGYLTSTVEHLQCGDREGAYTCFQRMVSASPRLLTELNIFYELGCGSQPKGWRGDFASLDIERNRAELFLLLERFFAEPKGGDELARYRNVAYANAYFVMGLLSYGARQLSAARAYLLRALMISPRYGLNRRFVSTLLKSLAGESGIEAFRQIRRRARVRLVNS